MIYRTNAESAHVWSLLGEAPSTVNPKVGRLNSHRPETMSNPHSVNSSLGSHRLTLPPDQSQNAPTFSSRPRHSDPHIHNVSPQQRPGSSRFIE